MQEIKKILEEQFPCSAACAINADPLDGGGFCSCGAEDKRQEFYEMVLKASPKKPLIYHRTIDLVGDDIEDETLCVMQGKVKLELPPQEALKLVREVVRAMKKNITDLERAVLWATDREKFMSYYEDRKLTI